MSNLLKLKSAALLLLCVCTTAQAQVNQAAADTVILDPINVTASKIIQTARQTSKNVVVIDRTEIQKNLSRNLGQLLNAQSGVIVNNSFGNRTNTQSIYLQGADNEYTLLLIDGIPVSDPSGNGGALDLRLLPLSNIERVEIVKGSQSTLYGTNAIAGVINIITKNASDRLISADGSISYGSFNSVNAAANIAGGTEKISYVLNYSYEGSDGISEAEDPGQGNDFDEDGINSNAFLSKVTIRPVDGLTITPSLNYSFFEAEFDDGSFADADNDLTLELINPAAVIKYSKNTFSIQGQYSYTETTNAFFSSFSPTPFKTEGSAQNADVFASEYLSDHIQILGGFAYQQFETPTGNGGEFDADILSPYTSLFFRNYDGFNAELGLRYNKHSEFGDELTYNISPSYNILIGNDTLDDLKVQASVSTGFRAPTLSELFGPFGSNSNLNPEKSFSIDGGISASLFSNSLNISMSYFNREIDNLILFSGFAGQLININRQEDQGIETSVSYRFSPKLSVNTFYNWLDGEQIADATGDGTFNLLRRPKNRVGTTINISPVKGLTSSLQWIYSSSRTDLFFDPITFIPSDVVLDPYHLVNLFAEYSISEKGISIFSDVRNLLNQDYNEVIGFNTPGINANIGIRFRFK